jgi:hypothetical protein
MQHRFTLIRSQWYGLTMLPGYGAGPYHSPIRVDHIAPAGQGRFDVHFLNLAYASGMHQFQCRWRTLKRGSTYLVAEDPEQPDRCYLVQPLTHAWMRSNYPQLDAAGYFDEFGTPADEALMRLA